MIPRSQDPIHQTVSRSVLAGPTHVMKTDISSNSPYLSKCIW